MSYAWQMPLAKDKCLSSPFLPAPESSRFWNSPITCSAQKLKLIQALQNILEGHGTEKRNYLIYWEIILIFNNPPPQKKKSYLQCTCGTIYLIILVHQYIWPLYLLQRYLLHLNNINSKFSVLYLIICFHYCTFYKLWIKIKFYYCYFNYSHGLTLIIQILKHLPRRTHNSQAINLNGVWS